MTGLEVSPIAFGTWELGGDWGAFDEEGESRRSAMHASSGSTCSTPRRATASAPRRQLLGKALRDDLDNRRDEVVIATKGGLRMSDEGLVRDASPEWLRSGVDESLACARRRAHRPLPGALARPEVPFAETAGSAPRAGRRRQDRPRGRLQLRRQQIAEFAKTRPVETIQPPYHLFRRDIERDDPALLPGARHRRAGLRSRSPTGCSPAPCDERHKFAAGDWRERSPILQGRQPTAAMSRSSVSSSGSRPRSWASR